MTKLRSNLVDKPQLANFARDELNLGKWMLLSNGEESTGGRNKDSLLSNCFEAIIGAYYIDSGIEAVRNFVNPLFEKILDNLPTTEDSTPEIKDDVKGRLQQFVCSSKFSHNPNKQPPIYKTIRSGGTDHEPEHTSVVSIAGIQYAEGKGRNGKEAEKQAAENALKILDVPSKK